MTDTNKMRDQFECWAFSQKIEVSIQVFSATNPPKFVKFHDPLAQSHWEAWQASRQAVVVDLPTDTRGMDAYEIKKATAAAIEAQGLRVGVRS